MGWDRRINKSEKSKELYDKSIAQVQSDIDSKKKTPAEYMRIYKRMIEKEHYEVAKAITEVLAPLNYLTIDTHSHIESLK